MAETCTDTTAPNPWDEKHKEGQKMVSDDKALLTLLIDSISLLRSEMVLSDGFWDLLVKKRVVDEKLKSDLQALNSQEFQVYDLVGHLMRGKVFQVHGFFWALVNTKQHSLVEMLGFPAQNYIDVQPMLKSSCISCPSCCEVFSTKAYILVQCGHYVCRPCIKGAKFSVEDYKTEGITCPVPDCGEVTKTLPNKDDEIGLENDDVFIDIVGDLMKDHSGDKSCHLCSSNISLSFRKHFCSGCKKFLCGACINEHEGEDHCIVHKHTSDVCCLHGKKTETFCLTCNVFRCDLKEEKSCGHKACSEEDKMNTSLQDIGKQIQEIDTKAEEFENLDILLEKRGAEMVDYIQNQHEKVKNNMDKWLDENVSYISRMTRYVRVKHMQSVQWKAFSLDLIGIQTDHPWVHIPLNKVDLTLSPEVEAFVSKVKDGEPPSNILSRISYVLQPPRKAMYIAKWTIPPGGYCYPTVAWTPDGQLLVATHTGLHRVNYDVASSSCTATLIHAATNPSHISCAEDGSWVMCMGYTGPGKLVIDDVNKEGVREWAPPGVKAWSAAIDMSGIYVRMNNSLTVYLYSRDLIQQRQYQIDPDMDNRDSLIHLSQTGEILLGLTSNNAILVMNPQTGESRSFQNKGNQNKLRHPVGVCTVGGGEYILVCEFKNHCVSVFTYQGEYLHDIDIEGDIRDPWSVSILERQGKPTLLALTTCDDDQDYLKLYTLS